MPDKISTTVSLCPFLYFFHFNLFLNPLNPGSKFSFLFKNSVFYFQGSFLFEYVLSSWLEKNPWFYFLGKEFFSYFIIISGIDSAIEKSEMPAFFSLRWLFCCLVVELIHYYIPKASKQIKGILMLNILYLIFIAIWHLLLKVW